MTPIKYIGYHKTMVFSVDHADMVQHLCVAFTEQQAAWLAWSLGRAHNVEHHEFVALPATFIRDRDETGHPRHTLNHPGSDRWTGGDRKDAP